MGKPDAPEPPDPRETAAAQTGTNISTAVANSFLNNVNRVGPDGSVIYRQTGSRQTKDPSTGETYNIPTFTQKTNLSPAGEALRKSNNRTKASLAGIAKDQSRALRQHLNKPINLRGLPEAGDASAITGGEETRARVEQALMDRLNPQLAQDREALRTQLSNQGIKLGSEAYDRGIESFGKQSNDARLAAILGAGQEASRVTDMDLAKFNAENTSRSSALSERTAIRNQPINEITALMSGSQVSQPSFSVNPVQSRIPTTDYAGLVNQNYQQRQQNAQAKAGAQQQLIGGLFGLGSAGIRAA